jgi:hypothetical protein
MIIPIMLGRAYISDHIVIHYPRNTQTCPVAFTFITPHNFYLCVLKTIVFYLVCTSLFAKLDI